MKNIAKIALIVFVSMLEVGYTYDCRRELYEKYKAHSAEFIKLKNKCKPLLENAKRLADEYRNTIAYKEYEAVELQTSEWYDFAEAERIYGQCVNSLEYEAYSKRLEQLRDISHKTQAYKAYEQANRVLRIEISATCKLFFDGVYDIDKAFERIAKAAYKSDKAQKVWLSTPQNKAYERQLDDKTYPYSMKSCVNRAVAAGTKYYAKLLETAEKALEPYKTAFRNSPEVKEYVAECRGITFPEDMYNMENFIFYVDWGEEQIISYIQSIIANRQ